jgi:di/tricarboxylate transporter
MGGISLGKAIESSGLLRTVVSQIQPYMEEISLHNCMLLITLIVVVVTSFISHTVGALIILPVVSQIGLSLPGDHSRTLVMAAALMCSGGMCLPVSSFPNMNAISVEGPTGEPWLEVKDFLIVGIISSMISWLAVISVGYTTMTLMGF